MSQTRAIARNTFLLTVGLMVGRILAIFIIKKMTPLLGPDGMGIWAWATEVTSIVLVIANFGLGTLITREISRARGMTWPIMRAALVVRWLVGAGCYLLLVVYVFASGKDALARSAMLVTALAVFIESTAMACDSVLQAHDKVKYQTLSQLVSGVVYFGLAFQFLDAGHGLMGVVWANFASRLVRLLVIAPLMRWRTGPWRSAPPPAAEAPGLMWMARLGWPLFLATTLGIVYFKIDIAMLTEMVGEAATGIYFLGHRPLDYMLFLPSLFATAFFPAMARYGTASEDVSRLGERALRYLLCTMLPLTLLIIFVAEPIIHWFEGRSGIDTDFADSIVVLRIVMLGVAFQSANYVFNRLLIAAGRERVFVTIATVPLLTNVVMNLVLIPRWSYFGAAIASVVSLVISCLMHLFFMRGTDLRVPLRRAVAGPATALAVGWLVTVFLARLLFPAWDTGWVGLPLQAGWGPFLAVTAAAGLLYGLALLGLRVVRGEDLQLLLKLGRGD